MLQKLKELIFVFQKVLELTLFLVGYLREYIP